MNLRKKHRDEGEVHTGPLNDILFILLLFFLIVSTMANPNVVKLSQPKSKSDTKAKQSVIVSINKNKQVYIGQDQIPFDSLEPMLRERLPIADSLNKPAVVINADSLVSWGDIVRVMEVAKKLGATTSASVHAK